MCLVKVIDGTVKRGDKIVAGHSKQVYDVDSVGIMFPDQHPTTALCVPPTPTLKSKTYTRLQVCRTGGVYHRRDAIDKGSTRYYLS